MCGRKAELVILAPWKEQLLAHLVPMCGESAEMLLVVMLRASPRPRACRAWLPCDAFFCGG